MLGCGAGEISDPSSGADADGSSGAAGNDDFFGGNGSAAPASCKAPELAVTTRLPRLTHAQYDNTVQALLGLSDVKPSAAFLGDPTFAGFDNSAESLAVNDRLGRDYRRAAEELSSQVISDASAYQKLVGCDPTANGCAETFVTQFLRKAFRRPATRAEIERYGMLHARGKELIGSGDDFADGVQLTIEAALQSPSFLYRTEMTRDVGSDGFVTLSDHEVAARLSYALWDRSPDAVLDEAADAGELHTPEQVALQARRMLDDARSETAVASFHRQWLELANYEDLLRDDAEFPLFSSELGKPMQNETLEFVRHVTFDLDEGLYTLLTAPFTFVNAQTAPLYGLEGDFDEEQMSKVELDPSERAGLFTQLGFLASHAFKSISSPIHRGVFIHRRVLCTKLPDPPSNANLVLPPITGEIKTTRQQVSTHTAASNCQQCHGVINPVGFAFENYDAVGQFRTLDNGEDVDATGEIQLDGKSVAFSNAVEFSHAIAESHAARSCYATQWLRFVYGREENAGDQCAIDTLAAAMKDDAYSTQDMLIDLAQTRAFLQRAAEDAP